MMVTAIAVASSVAQAASNGSYSTLTKPFAVLNVVHVTAAASITTTVTETGMEFCLYKEPSCDILARMEYGGGLESYSSPFLLSELGERCHRL